MVYIAFIFALALACVAAMEFISLMAMETRSRQLKRRISELEVENARLRDSLSSAEGRLASMDSADEEIWPELIDDSTVR